MRRLILFAASALYLLQSFIFPSLVLAENEKDKGLEDLLYNPINLTINEAGASDGVSQRLDEKETPFGVGLGNVAENYEESTSPKEDELEEVLEEFEEPEQMYRAAKPKEPSPLSISGWLELFTSYNYAQKAPKEDEADFRGLSHLRPELDIKLDLDFDHDWKARVGGRFWYDLAFLINGRDQYTDDYLDSMESEAEVFEAYLQGTLSQSLDVKAGRQIVVWGTSDNLRVTDVLNPLDLREIGLQDLEDLRLPVVMARLDYYVGHFGIAGIAIPEIRFNKIPAFGSDYFPFDAPLPDEVEPKTSLSHTEWALAATGRFTGWDLFLYAAKIYDDFAHVELNANLEPQRRHSRLTMLGLASNIALGNWLLKSELAYFDGLEFFQQPNDEKSRLDFLIGAEYLGFKNTTICLELVNRHLFDYDESLSEDPDNVNEDEIESALRITRDFKNDTMHLTFLAMAFGETAQNGAFERITLEYDWTDNFSTLLGVIAYQSGDDPLFEKIKNNDRIFLQLRYIF
jgi:hypothetical protein